MRDNLQLARIGGRLRQLFQRRVDHRVLRGRSPNRQLAGASLIENREIAEVFLERIKDEGLNGVDLPREDRLLLLECKKRLQPFNVGLKEAVDDFIKRSSVIYYSKDAFKNVYKDVAAFASLEGLEAHANSAKIRFEDINK